MKRWSLWKNTFAVLTFASSTAAFVSSRTTRRTNNHNSYKRLKSLDDELQSNLQSSERFPIVDSKQPWKDPNQPSNEKKELGIWAARGILLVVAAVWGTNFAVCVRMWTNLLRCILSLTCTYLFLSTRLDSTRLVPEWITRQSNI